ncbi:MAG: hypothetical protein FWH32_07595 [Clostridiales bacterium]|nr:hypothetical protein [Clostridiales bacterium]
MGSHSMKKFNIKRAYPQARHPRLWALFLAFVLALSFAGCGWLDDDWDDDPRGAPPPVIAADTTGFESNDGFVVDFHAIQVMAKGLDTDTGELFDMTRFVAGKHTMVRAAFADAVHVEQDGSMSVAVHHEGELLIELLPTSHGDAHEAYFVPRNMADVGNWEAGEYTLEFSYGESVATRTFTVRETKNIKVLAVPILANYGGRVVGCNGEWQTAIQFTRDTFPLASDGIEYVLGAELDLSDEMYDLMTDDGGYEVWEALRNLQTPDKDYELILGFAPERQGEYGDIQGYTYGKPASIITESDGDMQPTVAHEIAHCYYIGDEYPGGALNIDVNTPPYGMDGIDFNNMRSYVIAMKQAVVSANDYGNPNTGAVISPEQVPVNSTEMRVLGNVGSFMGSGGDSTEDYWITSCIWEQLFRAYAVGDDRTPTPTSDPVILTCPECYHTDAAGEFGIYALCDGCEYYWLIDWEDEYFECPDCGIENDTPPYNILVECPVCDSDFHLLQGLGKTDVGAAGAGSGMAGAGLSGNRVAAGAPLAKTADVLAAATAQDIRVLDIIGRLSKNGEFRASPWYSYEAESTDVIPGRIGEYAVVMEGAGGVILSTQHFDVSFRTGSNPPRESDYAPLDITVRYPDGVTAIKIVHGADTLYSVGVSANVPQVSFVGIGEDQLFSGRAEIRWAGSDLDGDTIYYELWYCPSEGEYVNLAADITETSFVVDFDALPGTDAGFFYLFATDGVNTGEADSEWIRVDYLAPEIISSQASVPEYRITDEIVFDADIYDAQDGWLFDEGVSWELDGREFMSGSFLWVWPYELPPGEHVFTLTAENSHGRTSSKDFTFLIVDDESALPNDWSRDDVRGVLENGFVAPLHNVNAAITRGQFATLAANLYWSLWEEWMPEPDYRNGVVTDCGQDDYDQFLMVELGLMEATGGRFRPTGNLTEEEAAVIFYRICAMSTPEGEDPTDTVGDMVEACIDAGVMDLSGENAYNAGENITGRLALVRLNRLFEYLFGD